MKSSKTVVCIGLMLMANACAFKGPKEAAKGEDRSPPTASLARVAWWSDDQKKSEPLVRNLDNQTEARLLRASVPFTLPVKAPNRIEVELSYPTNLAEFSPTSLSVQAVPITGHAVPITPKSISLLSRTGEWTNALIELEGIQSFFSENKEVTLDLRFLLQKSSGETALTLVVALRTPPALFKALQGPLIDSDLSDFTAADSLKHLDVAGEKLELLQISRVYNYSNYPIELTVQGRAKASLKIDRIKYRVQALGDCGFDSSMVRGKDPLKGEVRILPLSNELPQQLMSTQEASSARTISIAANQMARFGVYVSGPEAPLVGEGKYPKRKPTRVRMPDHCEARCDKKRTAAAEFPLCWMHRERYKSFHVSLQQIQECLACGNGNQRGCESCYWWEVRAAVYQQAGPNCLFCGEMVQIGEHDDIPIMRAIPQWRQETVWIENALSGDEDGDISIDSEALGSLMSVRYSELPVADDPETRTADLLKPSIAQDKQQ